MADISIQFHALPEELMRFIKEVAEDFSANVVAMRFFPFMLRPVSTVEIEHFFECAPDYRRWAFTQSEVALPIADELDFADKNPDHLRLEIGRRTERGLEQSWLTARTVNTDALATWRRVATRLKKMTNQGVTAINPNTGASSRMKSFRYTNGAKSLESLGIAMLPIAGTSLLKLG